MTQLEVDTRLGKIRPLNVWTGIAVGKIHVPKLADSQMYSGVIQGLGYALYEQKQYDQATGFTLSSNLNDYRIPGIGDVPDIHIHYDEQGFAEVRGRRHWSIRIGHNWRRGICRQCCLSGHRLAPPGDADHAGSGRDRPEGDEMMLHLIQMPADLAGKKGEIRAGGTDLQDRYRLGVSAGPILDIYPLQQEMGCIEQNEDGTVSIGAWTTIAAVGQHPLITSKYGGLAKTANGLATPQIRRVASIGGNLLQRTRCWYFRHPALACTKKGDAQCGGRTGHHPNGVIFDRGGCAHPHPATLAIALLAYDATVQTNQRTLSIQELFGDGSDHSRDHLLADQELLTEIILPAPDAGEKSAYFRSIARFEAEWPTVECIVRLVIAEGTIRVARIGVGGVSQVPLRLPNVEAALVGQPAEPANLLQAAELAREGANPLPQAAWKIDILVGTLLQTLEMALAET